MVDIKDDGHGVYDITKNGSLIGWLNFRRRLQIYVFELGDVVECLGEEELRFIADKLKELNSK